MGYWCYDRHHLVGLAIDQSAQCGLSYLKVIYYSVQLSSIRELNRSVETRRYPLQLCMNNRPESISLALAQ
ncbi:Hypothetical Protein PANA_2845 [Pantoea ananatis LMG 20103]|uniref:Uncharacterized protein n=1 Tax=Pantoea ananatis (strain LMG 20103) TaxID=706191 RepID=D4GK44_PANAM|nr:Hypothetical Protein PANA_2845 [Pantoea ananatis LMG 20103]